MEKRRQIIEVESSEIGSVRNSSPIILRMNTC